MNSEGAQDYKETREIESILEVACEKKVKVKKHNADVIPKETLNVLMKSHEN